MVLVKPHHLGGEQQCGELNRYIESLRSAGFETFANQIREAKLSGSIGSEILGLVWLELKKAKDELGENQDFLVKKANELIREIDAILG